MLGIAGVIGSSPKENAFAAQAMVAQMKACADVLSSVEILGTGDRSVALAAVGRSGGDFRHDHTGDVTFQDQGSVITFSGAIYNLPELGRELLGTDATPDSVAQTLLRAYRRHGPDFVRHLRGMFALAIWDGREQRLFLARDRFGIMPLYYWQSGDHFLFASKVKALLATDIVPFQLSEYGVLSFLAYGSPYEPLTIIEGISAFPAANWGIVRGGELCLASYWDIFADHGTHSLSLDDAAAELRPLLSESVRRHVSSAADPCVLLSGGMDSSMLAALTKEETGSVSTVSVFMHGAPSKDEPYAELVQRHLGSKHITVQLDQITAHRWLDDCFVAMDQPALDGFNVYAAARAAADHGYSSALYALAGDELFGPCWDLDHVRSLERLARIPSLVATPAGVLLGAIWRGNKGSKAREWLTGGAVPGASYEYLRRIFTDRELQKLWHGTSDPRHLPKMPLFPDLNSYMCQNSQIRLATNTKNVLLKAGAWAGTSQGIQMHFPFIDHVVMEWAVRLPVEYRMMGFKTVLARATEDLLPREVFVRPKWGFVMPFWSWMQNGLRDGVDRDLQQPPDLVKALVNLNELQRMSIMADYRRNSDEWHRPWAIHTLSRWVEQAEKGKLVTRS